MNQSYSHDDTWKKDLENLARLMGELPDEKELRMINLGSSTGRVSTQVSMASENEVWDYEVLKRKNGKPTVIRVNGEQYQLQHRNQFNRKGGKR